MLPTTSTAQQLRQARERIAVLERELHTLRNSVATTPASPSSSPRIPRHISKSRRPIMTRRAAAAAAAAAAVTLQGFPSEHTSDVSKSTSCQPPARQSPAQFSDISRNPSQLSSSHPPVPDLAQHPMSSDLSLADNTSTSTMVVPTPHIPVTTLELPLRTDHLNLAPFDMSAAIQHPTNISRSTTPITVASGKPTPSSPITPPLQCAAPTSRKQTSLPVTKTASTKKEKLSLVAKCTEPKPGQTRYWTDEEHERFLVAMAEHGEKAYVAISNYVETRTPKQVRTHAQKFQMKMARLARQSIEAGQPIQTPAGMRPVVELPIGTKSTIVTITPDQSIKLASKSSEGLSEIDPSILNALSTSQMQHPPAKKTSELAPDRKTEHDAKPQDALVKTCSNISDDTSSALTDPYLNYIGAAGDVKEETDLENTFAAKLTQTLHEPRQASVPSDDADFLMSDGSSDDAKSSAKDDDDDLEDLENLEDGDLSLAPFSNPTENWLLGGGAITPCDS